MISVMKTTCCSILFLVLFHFCRAGHHDGLWIRYTKTDNAALLQQYRRAFPAIHIQGGSPTLDVARTELQQGLRAILGQPVDTAGSFMSIGIIAGAGKQVQQLLPSEDFTQLGKEGFVIRQAGNRLVISANTDVGVLYGVYHFLRLLQTQQPVPLATVKSSPKIQHRILNHWDNLNRYVERGYSGISIWNWHTLPDYIDQRYIDYARANAAIGINGTVLTNVNANALVLTRPYLEKVAALAKVFRPYGIRVYLTARFSAPIEIGGLKTADPLDADVQAWWKTKAKEIYDIIPDFGGFLVKANSEGQPGPQNYKRTHADGANMLADAVAPFNGIVMWRAFVYTNETPEDRFKQAYNEFKPLDGQFRNNVLVQVKNGPIDFQPREPFSPLFGAMPKTPLMMEFQVTQEYLGQGTHLLYEAQMFKEALEADTWQKGKGSTVARVIDGSLHQYKMTGIAGVANIGNDANWTGHPFGQANWYTFGRLAWDHELSATAIADEWIKQSFGNHKTTVHAVRNIMLASYPALVNYMTPLGLHHIMGTGHHYGPAPWVSNAGRADWNPVYYHQADTVGIGFNRTATGSNALAQYAPQVRQLYENINTCPEAYLLWFHHVPWQHKMRSGRTLWEELCHDYYAGVDAVKTIRQQWQGLKGLVDEERFSQVSMLLDIQVKEATWWRDACLLYFGQFSRRPLPTGYEQPDKTLEYYQQLRFPYAPGNGQ